MDAIEYEIGKLKQQRKLWVESVGNPKSSMTDKDIRFLHRQIASLEKLQKTVDAQIEKVRQNIERHTKDW